MNRWMTGAAIAALGFAASSCALTSVETWQGDVVCNSGEKLDAVVYLDLGAKSKPFGFYCLDDDSSVCVPIVKARKKGDEYELETANLPSNPPYSIELELTRDGDTMEGKFGVSTSDNECDIELDLEN